MVVVQNGSMEASSPSIVALVTRILGKGGVISLGAEFLHKHILCGGDGGGGGGGICGHAEMPTIHKEGKSEMCLENE